jgi:chromosome segregation ATPase
MGRLFEKVNAVAAQLQENLSGLDANIQASRDSIEKGGEVLDAMLESVKRVNASMDEDSEIWTELDALLELWEQRRQETLTKSESNPAFLPIAQAWQSRLDKGRELRNQISTERANSLALMRAIESDRDIVLAYYELGQADKAIESLQKVGANLTSLNENMQAIVKTANDAQQVPIAP